MYTEHLNDTLGLGRDGINRLSQKILTLVEEVLGLADPWSETGTKFYVNNRYYGKDLVFVYKRSLWCASSLIRGVVYDESELYIDVAIWLTKKINEIVYRVTGKREELIYVDACVHLNINKPISECGDVSYRLRVPERIFKEDIVRFLNEELYKEEKARVEIDDEV